MQKPSMILMVFLAILFAATTVSAATLMWDPSEPCGDPDTCAVDGYNIYYGEVGGEMIYKVTVDGATEKDLADLRLSYGKTYRFAVTAWNAVGESDQTEPIEYTVPQYTPGDDILPDAKLVIKMPNKVKSLRFVFE